MGGRKKLPAKGVVWPLLSVPSQSPGAYLLERISWSESPGAYLLRSIYPEAYHNTYHHSISPRAVFIKGGGAGGRSRRI